MSDYIIAAQDVHKTFRTGKIEVYALRGVDFSVKSGEMVAIMGPSGCGKTTMLNCLSGLDEFDSGEVYIDGTDLRSMGDKARTSYRARSMGFVFQTFNLLPVINAVENVELPLLVSGVRPRDARSRALAALEQDDVILEALGPYISDRYLAAKRQELASYHSQVTPWEVERYLARY